MSDMAVFGNGFARPAALRARRVRLAQGERLAVRTTAAAVAMLPLLRPGGPANIAPADVFIALALGSCLLWAGASGHRWRFPYVLPVSLFILGGALGALRGPVPGTGAIALVQDVILLFWCWTLVNVASSPERFRTIVRTWVYSSIVWTALMFVGLASGLTILTGQTEREGVRTSLTFIDPNISGNYYFLSLMLMCATQFPRRRGRRYAAYALMLAAIFTTGSSGAMVSVLVGVSVAAVLGIHRRSGLVPAITAACFGLLLFGFVHSTVKMSTIQAQAASSQYRFIRDGLGREDQSVEFRSQLVSESRGLYARSGALGAGPVSTKVRLERAQEPFVKEAHDDYLAAIVERGVIGFSGLILLIAIVAKRTLSLTTRPLARGFAEVFVRPNALVGALAGTLTAAAVYEVLHVRHVWALFSIVAAANLWGQDE
jgi:O-Antigen ligase